MTDQPAFYFIREIIYFERVFTQKKTLDGSFQKANQVK